MKKDTRALDGLTLREQATVIRLANDLLALSVLERIGETVMKGAVAQQQSRQDDKPRWVRGALVSPKKR